MVVSKDGRPISCDLHPKSLRRGNIEYSHIKFEADLLITQLFRRSAQHVLAS